MALFLNSVCKWDTELHRLCKIRPSSSSILHGLKASSLLLPSKTQVQLWSTLGYVRPRPAAEPNRRESWGELSWCLDRNGSSPLLLLQRVAENYLPLPHFLPQRQRAAAYSARAGAFTQRGRSRHCFGNQWVRSVRTTYIAHRLYRT